MGQYYYIVNIDKEQYLHPHKFRDGLKLMEFGQSAGGTLLGLTILLADGNNRGGGDCRSDDPLIGSWAGDRIVIAGGYADGGNFLPETDDNTLQSIANNVFSVRKSLGKSQSFLVARQRASLKQVNLHHYAQEKFEDISEKVIAVLVTAHEWERE